MRLVALARAPSRPEEAARVLAGAAGLTFAEARMRLAAEAPALLARLDANRAEEVVSTLRAAGLAALAVEPEVPSDRDRLVALRFEISDAGAVFTPRAGDGVAVAWAEVLAVLRGVRSARQETERTEKSRRLSVAAAVATSGLVVTRGVERTVRSSEEAAEQVILVYPRAGRAVTVAEGSLDFSCLGPGLQPSSTANMAEVARRIRQAARGAFYDERLLRLGRRSLPFVAGGESRTQSRTAVTRRTDTSGTLDLLAEVMRRALVEGLLP
ncbi:MAG TPA: hypothetical protein VEP68_09860 [Anaeromyxobacteraceae bacterium]|nr:hypothetical protein [Anaeromyxobacteraceae bacterium]